LEVSQPDKFYVRAYMTAEDAGNSYDAVFTALRMQEYSKSDVHGHKIMFPFGPIKL
jgi:iron complex outermembrane receptor protein